MHKHIILNNGLTMPAVGFGTWMLKGEAGKQAIQEALSVGYRLIDTAHMYDNEAIVGQAVAEDDDVIPDFGFFFIVLVHDDDVVAVQAFDRRNEGT